MNVRTSVVRCPGRGAAHLPPLAALACVLAGLALGGCATDELADPDAGTPIARPSTPSYLEAATAHNSRATVRTAISADAVGTARWTEQGQDGQPVERILQVEGKIFADGPGRIYLAVRKLSQTGAVLGMGSGVFFFVNLNVEPKTMYWGTIGEPLDYARLRLTPDGSFNALLAAAGALDDLLALGPVPTGEVFGGTQWSTNGHLLGISYRRTGSGGAAGPTGPLVRRWVAGDGDSRTVQTEVFDVGPDGSTRVAALVRMTRSDVLVGGAFAPPPVLPLELQVVVGDAAPLRLDLRISEVRAESSLSPALFDAREQLKTFNVDRLIPANVQWAQPASSAAGELPGAAPVGVPGEVGGAK